MNANLAQSAAVEKDQPRSTRNVFAGLALASLMALAGCGKVERVVPPNADDKNPGNGPGLVLKPGEKDHVLRAENSVVIPKIARVWMHEPGTYSVMAMEGNELVEYDLRGGYHGGPAMLKLLGFRGVDVTGSARVENVRIVQDVKGEDPKWVKIDFRVEGSTVKCNIAIHVRDVNDIGGGSYRQSTGKNSSKLVTTGAVD